MALLRVIREDLHSKILFWLTLGLITVFVFAEVTDIAKKYPYFWSILIFTLLVDVALYILNLQDKINENTLKYFNSFR